MSNELLSLLVASSRPVEALRLRTKRRCAVAVGSAGDVVVEVVEVVVVVVMWWW